MRILREAGFDPFVGWAERPRGLKTSDVARKLGVGTHLVKDRVARMTEAGVITGYRLLPNLRHCGQDLTVYHLRSATVPDEAHVARLGDVDGFDRVVWFLDSGLCINLSHGNAAERDRRMRLIRQLIEDDGPAKILYSIDFPRVDRALTDLDWRIVRTLEPDAKRPLHEVADELGVTTKTVRTRLNRMRDEGSVDEYAALDLSKVEGVVPFQLAVWFDEDADATDELRHAFDDRYLAHFEPPAENGYCSYMLRIFAYTPAEVQALVREALDVPGVARAEPMVATGGWDNERWISELLDAHAPAPLPSS